MVLLLSMSNPTNFSKMAQSLSIMGFRRPNGTPFYRNRGGSGFIVHRVSLVQALGVRAQGRTVKETPGQFELREPGACYHGAEKAPCRVAFIKIPHNAVGPTTGVTTCLEKNDLPQQELTVLEASAVDPYPCLAARQEGIL
jgi:hypothetical protein